MSRPTVATVALLGSLLACAPDEPPTPACHVEVDPSGAPVVVCVDGTRARLPGGGVGCVLVEDGAGTSVACPDGTAVDLERPSAARGCWFATIDGAAVVRCADGSEVRVGAGAGGRSCEVEQREAGTRTSRCPDGTSATLRDGADGGGCAVVDHADGTRTVLCEDGTRVTLRAGEAGTPCTLETGPGDTRVLACSDGSRVAIVGGSDGSGCEVAAEPGGVQRVRCSDGTEVEVRTGDEAATCAVEPLPGGGYAVVCPDGTRVVVVPDGVARGEVVGSVRLLGALDASGATVAIPALGLRTTCESSGAFALAGVPAGVHEVVVEHDGFEPARVADVIVVGGTTRLAEVVLRRAERVGAGVLLRDAQVLDGGSWVTYARYEAGVERQIVRDLATGEERRIASWPGRVLSVGDGRSLLVVEDAATRGALARHDLSGGTRTLLDEGVEGNTVVVAARGDAIAYARERTFVGDTPYGFQAGLSAYGACDSFQFGERTSQSIWAGELLVRDLASGRALYQAPQVCLGRGRLVRERWLFEKEDCWAWGGDTLLLADTATGAATHLGAVPLEELLPSPGGGHAAFRRREAGTVAVLMLDLVAGTETRIGEAWGSPSARWRPDGAMLAWADRRSQVYIGRPSSCGSVASLFVWDTATNVTSSLGEGTAHSFLPDSTGLLIDQPDPATGRFGHYAVRALATGEVLMLPSGTTPLAEPWAPDSSRLYLTRGPDPGVRELVEVELASGVETRVSASASLSDGGPRVGPGGAVLFHEPLEAPYSALVLWDPATATRTEVSRLVHHEDDPWRRATPDGRRFLYTERHASTLTPDDAGYVEGEQLDLWLWDVAFGAGVRLCESCDAARIEPDGRSVVFARPGLSGPIAELGLFDADLGTAVLIDEDVADLRQGDGYLTYTRRAPGPPDTATRELYLLRFP